MSRSGVSVYRFQGLPPKIRRTSNLRGSIVVHADISSLLMTLTVQPAMIKNDNMCIPFAIFEMEQEAAWELARKNPLSGEVLLSRPFGNSGRENQDLMVYLKYIAGNRGLHTGWINHFTFKIPCIFADGGLFIAFSSVNPYDKGYEYRVYEGTAVRHIEYEDDDYSEEEVDENAPITLVPCKFPQKSLIREVDGPDRYLLDFVREGTHFCGRPIGGTFLDSIEPYIGYRYGVMKG